MVRDLICKALIKGKNEINWQEVVLDQYGKIPGTYWYDVYALKGYNPDKYYRCKCGEVLKIADKEKHDAKMLKKAECLKCKSLSIRNIVEKTKIVKQVGENQFKSIVSSVGTPHCDYAYSSASIAKENGTCYYMSCARTDLFYNAYKKVNDMRFQFHGTIPTINQLGTEWKADEANHLCKYGGSAYRYKKLNLWCIINQFGLVDHFAIKEKTNSRYEYHFLYGAKAKCFAMRSSNFASRKTIKDLIDFGLSDEKANLMEKAIKELYK